MTGGGVPSSSPPIAELAADGRLLQSRAVGSIEPILTTALDRSLTGFARIEPGETLLSETTDRGVLTFADGIPMAAYHTGADAVGERALAELSTLGPYHIDLYTLPADRLQSVHATDRLLVPPGRPAERLAGNPTLAERTRTAASQTRIDRTREADPNTLAAFLADEERIEAIQQQAQAEAKRRAREWGLEESLTDSA